VRIVLDTNVLVSGLLSPFGPPAEIVRLVAAGKLTVCHDGRILAEYAAVLLRPRFGFDAEAVGTLLRQLASDGEPAVGTPLPRALPDPGDMPFLEVARGAGADALVTGNLRHFPARLRYGVRVLSPRDFVESVRGRF
jgi:uncharacterized protein